MVGMIQVFKKSTVALGLIVAFSGSVSAQQSDTGTQGKELERISVTAQKRTQSVQDVPISITAFSGDMLSDMGLTETDQIGQFIPGLEISTSSGEGSQLIIFMRGAGLNDFNTNNAGPVGIYSDEVYISSPALTAFQFFDTERLEILKGPQGTLYGRNTTGGAIKFITNKPTEDFEVSGRVSVGSFNTTGVDGAISGSLTDTVKGRFAFTKNDSDGYATNLMNGKDVNGSDSLAYRGLLEFSLDNLNVLFNFHGANVDSPSTSFSLLGATLDGSTPCNTEMVLANQCVTNLGYKAPDDPFEGNYNGVQDIDLNSVGSYLQVDYDLGDLRFTSITAYDELDRFLMEETDGAPQQVFEIVYGVESDTLSQEFRVTGGSKENYWLLGAFYLSEDLQQDQTLDLFRELRAFTGGLSDPTGEVTGAPIIFGRTLNQQEIESTAIFGQATFALSDDLNLTVGARYTDESRKFDAMTRLEDEAVFGPDHYTLYNEKDLKVDSSATSYRLAVDYKLSEKMLGYASISRGYKSGGFNGGFLSLDAAEAAIQLTPYDPEYLTAYEIGFKSDSFDNRLRFNAAIFFNDFDDLQVFTLLRTETLPIVILDNASNAEVLGLEFDATALVAKGLTLSLSGAFMDSELIDFQAPIGDDYSGNQIANTPDTSISGIARYEHYLNSGAAIITQVSFAYKDDLFFSTENNPIVAQKAFTTANARLGYENAEGNWEVAAYVNNLTDKEYTTNVTDTVDLGGSYARTFALPRQYGVEFNFRF